MTDPGSRTAPPPYRGRFAPSPTGPLHFGSLVAAVGSYLEARRHGGEWLLRMEDVDAPRCRADAAEQILHALAAFGFEWDGAVIWQSRRSQAYAAALEALRQRARVFACACTRRELADSGLTADGAALYPGTCRQTLPAGRTARAWRLRVGDSRIRFVDAMQGEVVSDLASEVGDFIVRRADGLFAYQLAVVVDDADAGITHVVRGADLLGSTSRQLFLQSCLDLPHPAYTHLPVVVNAAGEKLSKQTRALAIDVHHPVPELVAALDFLGQSPPPELAGANLAELWCWARANWRLERVPKTKALAYNRAPAD